MSEILTKARIKSSFLNNEQIINEQFLAFIKTDKYLSFIISKLFPNSLTVESFLNSLDNKITKFIIQKEFNLKINCSDAIYNKENAEDIFIFSVILEKKYNVLATLAPDYYKLIVLDLPLKFLNDFLKTHPKITGLVKIVAENRRDATYLGVLSDYHIFDISRSLDYYERLEFLTDKLFDIKKLFRYAIKNSEPLLAEIMNLYPELYTHKPILKKERLNYFTDPSMLHNFNMIRCYSASHPYFINSCMRSKGEKSYVKNMNILYRMIIVENHISHNTKLFCKKILQPFIIETPEILNVMIRRKFDIDLIDEIIEHTPSFYTSFDICLSLFLSTSDFFYEVLVKALVVKYPTYRNISKIMLNKQHFRCDFLEGMEQIIMEFNNITG